MFVTKPFSQCRVTTVTFATFLTDVTQRFLLETGMVQAGWAGTLFGTSHEKGCNGRPGVPLSCSPFPLVTPLHSHPSHPSWSLSRRLLCPEKTGSLFGSSLQSAQCECHVLQCTVYNWFLTKDLCPVSFLSVSIVEQPSFEETSSASPQDTVKRKLNTKVWVLLKQPPVRQGMQTSAFK